MNIECKQSCLVPTVFSNNSPGLNWSNSGSSVFKVLQGHFNMWTVGARIHLVIWKNHSHLLLYIFEILHFNSLLLYYFFFLNEKKKQSKWHHFLKSFFPPQNNRMTIHSSHLRVDFQREMLCASADQHVLWNLHASLHDFTWLTACRKEIKL